jgi:hypothetical protein
MSLLLVQQRLVASSGVVVPELDESNNRIAIRNALLIISLYSEDYNDSCLSSV